MTWGRLILFSISYLIALFAVAWALKLLLVGVFGMS